MAAPARSAARRAVSLNNHDAARPLNTVRTLPRQAHWLASGTPEYQRRSPPPVLHFHLAPATEEARSCAARRRELESQGRRHPGRRPAATDAIAASATRVREGKMTTTSQVAHTVSRFGSRVKVVFGTSKEGSPLRAVLPNPSLEARPNGRPPGPGRRYAVHFRQPGPGVLPLVPPQLER